MLRASRCRSVQSPEGYHRVFRRLQLVIVITATSVSRRRLVSTEIMAYTSEPMPASGSYRYGHMPTAACSGFRPDMFTSPKHPPHWGPELERVYPFRHWQKDVELWSAGTDVLEVRQGPLRAARLGGMARSIAHTLTMTTLQHGTWVQGVQMTGMQVLLRGLARRFAPFTAETASRSMMEYLGFRRGNAETIDEAISWWELLAVRAEEQAGFSIGPPGATLLLFVALGMPEYTWWHYLSPTNGDFPTTVEELTEITQKLCKERHIAEGSPETTLFADVADDAPQFEYQRSGPPMFAFTEGQDEQDNSTWWAGSDATTATPEYWVTDESGFPCRMHCGSWFYQEGEDADDDSYYPPDGDSTASDDDNSGAYEEPAAKPNLDELRATYLWARREYRRAAGKPQRHVRFPRRDKGKGRGNGEHRRKFDKGKGGDRPILNPGMVAGGKGRGFKGRGKPGAAPWPPYVQSAPTTSFF